jgi:uncharacterized sulfatase
MSRFNIHRIRSLAIAQLCALAINGSLIAAPPNIVFILTDDQAPTAVGILGNEQLKTPNIDRIFREGMTLANSFVVTPVCSPSRASLMTSRYGTELGITDWINPRAEKELGLDPATVTWPELLASGGYETGLVGKWHLGTADKFHPTKTGFKYFMGIRSGGTKPMDATMEVDGKDKKFTGYTYDILTDHALQFVDKNKAKPFLLCLHYRAPHAPWLPAPESDWGPYRDLDPKIPNPAFPKLNTPKIKRMTREYYASMAGVDRNVGRVLKQLDDLKLAENTVVIFTSDHGYNLGHHGVWYKGNSQWMLTELPPQKWPHIGRLQRPNLWDQSLRVPTAVRWPNVIRPGSRLGNSVTNLDWYPTLLAMAGVKKPENVLTRGHDFLPLLRGEKAEWNDAFYSEYSMKHGAKTHMRAWRTPQWKLMRDFKNPGRAELYDLVNDPGETKNLIDSRDPMVQGIKKEYETRLLVEMKKIGDPALDVGGV